MANSTDTEQQSPAEGGLITSAGAGMGFSMPAAVASLPPGRRAAIVALLSCDTVDELAESLGWDSEIAVERAARLLSDKATREGLSALLECWPEVSKTWLRWRVRLELPDLKPSSRVKALELLARIEGLERGVAADAVADGIAVKDLLTGSAGGEVGRAAKGAVSRSAGQPRVKHLHPPKARRTA